MEANHDDLPILTTMNQTPTSQGREGSATGIAPMATSGSRASPTLGTLVAPFGLDLAPRLALQTPRYNSVC